MSPVRSDENPQPSNDKQGCQYFSITLENDHQITGLLSREGVVLEIELPIISSRQPSRDEVVGNYLWDTMWWQDQPEAQNLIKGAVHEARQGKTVRFKSTIPGSSPKTMTIDFTLRPIGDDDTEFKSLENRLLNSEKRHRYLAHQLRMLNQMGQIVVTNQNIQYIFNEVLTRVREIIGAQSVNLLLEKNGQLIIEAQNNENNQNLQGIMVSSTDSLSGDVWRRQESIILSGNECRSRFYKPRAEIMGYMPLSYLGVPITWQDQKFGVLDAVHSEDARFNIDDLKLAESAAAWTAIALNNAIQHHHLERRVAESQITTSLLEEILSASLTLQSVLQHVVEAGRTIIPDVDWSAIHLLEEREHRLRLEAVAGVTVSVEEYTLEPGQGIAGRVFESGNLINVADVSQDTRVAGYPRTSRSHSLLVAPIKDREGIVIGTITLQSTKIDQFTDEDERLLVLLAHQAGLAIENARLYETAEYRWRIAQLQRERLRHLTHQLVTAQENERERIARELHDEAGQSLTALKISLELLSNSLPADMQDTRQALVEIAEQAGATLENLRSIAHNLRPPALERLGLNLALMGLCQQFESMTHIRTIYEGYELPRLPSSHEINLYRFVQEALTNVAKHAEATEVRVWLDIQTGQIEIHIQDNGKGMQIDAMDLEREVKEGMGLTSIEERLNIIDGRLDVHSIPGKGTHLSARVALRLRETTP